MASPKKSPRPKKGKKKKTRPPRIYRRLLSPLILLSILLFSLLAAGYVIFFRTVVAGELQQEDVGKGEVQKEPTDEAVAPAKRDLPKVAIIIDDLGYNEEIAMAFLDLPIELTYSFLPFAPYTKKLARLAHRRGKTVFLHLPLEPKDKTKDPGPGAIYLSDSPEVQLEKLERCLEAVPHAVGVNNHMGSAFTEDREAMARVISLLHARSLSFVDSVTTNRTVAAEVAQEMMTYGFSRTEFLDNAFEKRSVCNHIELLFLGARKHGFSIGIGHPSSQTLEDIKQCVVSKEQADSFVSMKVLLERLNEKDNLRSKM